MTYGHTNCLNHTCAYFNIVYHDEAHENMDIMQIISFVAPRRKIIGYVSNIMKVCKWWENRTESDYAIIRVIY